MLQFAAATCDAIRPLVDGPAVQAHVVGHGPHAVYIRTRSEVLAVIPAGALALPCALVLAPGRALPGSLAPGVAVRVGRGRVQWRDTDGGEVAVVPTRWWPAPQVVARTTAPQAIGVSQGASQLEAALLGHTQPVGVAQALADAAAALSGGAPERAARHLVRVLGRGPGLTPSGDDAAAGLLLTARALAGTPSALADVEHTGRLVADAAFESTTAISAALLRHAAAGRAAQVVIDAITAAVDGGPGTAGALEALLRLGHTSGADTAFGMLAAVRADDHAGLETA